MMFPSDKMILNTSYYLGIQRKCGTVKRKNLSELVSKSACSFNVSDFTYSISVKEQSNYSNRMGKLLYPLNKLTRVVFVTLIVVAVIFWISSFSG